MKQTPLHAEHLSLSAKMGEFAGYDMPLYYKDGVMQEHLWTRTQAGLFDVSHMGQVILRGAGTFPLLEYLTPSSYKALQVGAAKYTVLMNEAGGIIDDLIVTRLNDTDALLVLNAGCKDKDIDWITRYLPEDVTLEYLTARALLALQGPVAEAVLRDVLKIDLADLPYMHMRVAGDLWISRLGYTGEDGFEVSVPASRAVSLWRALLQDARVKPIGLAARDTLRLEMQYCLYGHEIDAETSPLEADLAWIMRKGDPVCIGADALRTANIARVRIGIRLLDRGVAREGAVIVDSTGRAIGALTSGSFSPSLQCAIGMGYVPPALATHGQRIGVVVRDTTIPAEIVRGAFMPAKTKTKKEKA